MLPLEGVPLIGLVGLFAVAAVAIMVIGTRFTAVVDRLADRTGLGEAVAGAIFLGATTSLPDLVVSCSAAYDGRADFAMSNAIGGIAAQTAFLAVADLSYRRANLEHAAASLTNILQATLLVILLGLPLMAIFAPAVTVAGCNVASGLMILAYVAGMRVVSRQRNGGSWSPRRSRETVDDQSDQDDGTGSTRRLWWRFTVGAMAVVTAGYLVAQSGMAIADRTGLSQSAVGAVFTGVATSSGELVTSLAAVRRGALTLAVGGIIGGNSFDTLLLSASDVAYRGGSVYHAVGRETPFLLATTIVMTGVLLLGLLARQKHGMANIGFESALTLLLYGGTIIYLFAV